MPEFVPDPQQQIFKKTNEIFDCNRFILLMHYSDHSIHCKWLTGLSAIILFGTSIIITVSVILETEKTYLIQNTGKLLYESSKERRTFPWLKL